MKVKKVAIFAVIVVAITVLLIVICSGSKVGKYIDNLVEVGYEIEVYMPDEDEREEVNMEGKIVAIEAFKAGMTTNSDKYVSIFVFENKSDLNTFYEDYIEEYEEYIEEGEMVIKKKGKALIIVNDEDVLDDVLG